MSRGPRSTGPPEAQSPMQLHCYIGLRQAPPTKLVSWIRFPIGSYRRLEKRSLRISSLVLGVDGRCKKAAHKWCCHWHVTSAAFNANAAA